MSDPAISDRKETLSCDVLVVGCGYAGAVAAIAAHDAGAEVVVLEKMPDAGGISVCSAGGLRVAEDAGEAFAYLQATNAGTTPDDVLRRLAEGMVALPEAVAALAAGTGARVSRRASPGNYPLPGHRTFGFVYVEEIEGFDPRAHWPQVKGSPAGACLFRVLQLNLERRRIALRCNTAVRRLVRAADGSITGAEAAGPQGPLFVRARGGVVLACGGFEGDAVLQQQFWEAKPVLSAAFRGNTGDGIRMAQAAGAALWHMWHFHGSYGFRHPDPAYPFGIRTKRVPDWRPGEAPPADVRLPWILLDKTARRFANEYQPYLQDTGARALGRLRPEHQDFATVPAWLIADEDGRALYPFGRPTHNERGIAYDWSRDNRKEIGLGILRQADSLEELAAGTGLPADRLTEEIQRWNAACTAAEDRDFGRPPTSMMPLRRPPFCYGEVWPVVSNTQGGPVHDAEQRVLDPYDAPIGHLYAAGELGSAFGHLYMSGGNLAECFIGGAITGRNAAARERL